MNHTTNTLDFNSMFDTIDKLVQNNKGLLYIDKNIINEDINADQTLQNNKLKFVESLFMLDNLEKLVNGIIIHDNIFYKNRKIVQSLIDKNILIGVKVNKNISKLPGSFGETITQGLDDLEIRCKKYYENGANFTCFECFFEIDVNKGFPTILAIKKNASILAQYAAIVQNNNLIPIIESTILVKEVDDIWISEFVSRKILSTIIYELNKHNVSINMCILKPSIIMFNNINQFGNLIEFNEEQIYDIAFRTIRLLQDVIPISIPGIFMSFEYVSENNGLDILKNMVNIKTLKPWFLSYMYILREINHNTPKILTEILQRNNEILKN